jgi:NTP pyrophosphatase (non-canonical NTP hydrolase)
MRVSIEYGAWCCEFAEAVKKDEAADLDSVQSEAEDAA